MPELGFPFAIDEAVVIVPEYIEGTVFAVHETVTTVITSRGSYVSSRSYMYTIKTEKGMCLRSWENVHEDKQPTPPPAGYASWSDHHRGIMIEVEELDNDNA